MIWELLTGASPYKGINGMAIAYGVAMNKLNLHIPSSCPEDWRSLMKECWQLDCHHRPTFKSIIDRLDMVANFPDESFHLMQEKWQEEIREGWRRSG